MKHEYYFNKKVNEYTWQRFAKYGDIDNDKLEEGDKFYRITDYGWQQKFVFNPNGKAMYISKNGKIFDGVWFEIGDRRIVVFEKHGCM